MTGSGLMDFLIVVVGLIIIGAIIFAALEYVATDPRFKKIAQLAVGGVLVLAFLFALKGVFFGGAAAVISPTGLIQFAIGVIVLLVVWYVFTLLIDWCASVFPPIGQFVAAIKFVVSAVVLIVLLLLAASLLFGASMGSYSPFRGGHAQLEYRETQRQMLGLAGYRPLLGQYERAEASPTRFL